MNLLFHHIGVACRELDDETRTLSALGYQREGPDFTDPVQGIAGRFLVGAGPRLELLAPLSETGVLRPWLNAGVKLYHLAYEARDVTAAIADLRAQGARLIVPPTAAVAFSGRKIAFLMLPNLLLSEIIALP